MISIALCEDIRARSAEDARAMADIRAAREIANPDVAVAGAPVAEAAPVADGGAGEEGAPEALIDL